MTEGEMVGWHHRLDGREFEPGLGDGEGQGSLECCGPWGRKESATTWQLNTATEASGGLITVQSSEGVSQSAGPGRGLRTCLLTSPQVLLLLLGTEHSLENHQAGGRPRQHDPLKDSQDPFPPPGIQDCHRQLRRSHRHFFSLCHCTHEQTGARIHELTPPGTDWMSASPQTSRCL